MPEPAPQSQRRRFPRYRTDLAVTVYLATGATVARISQISRGGCLIFPPLPAKVNPAVKLSFRMAEDLPFVNCKGEIVYSVMDRGTGVAFTEISQFNQDLITEYFEKQVAAGKISSA